MKMEHVGSRASQPFTPAYQPISELDLPQLLQCTGIDSPSAEVREKLRACADKIGTWTFGHHEYPASADSIVWEAFPGASRLHVEQLEAGIRAFFMDRYARIQQFALEMGGREPKKINFKRKH